MYILTYKNCDPGLILKSQDVFKVTHIINKGIKKKPFSMATILQFVM